MATDINDVRRTGEVQRLVRARALFFLARIWERRSVRGDLMGHLNGPREWPRIGPAPRLRRGS